MNNFNNLKKINLDFENMRVLYKHYKEFLLPVGVILISFLVIFYVVFPQIQQYFSSQDLVKVEQQKLDSLRNNYNLLTSLDNATITSDLGILSPALPAQKDFAGIIDAIAYVSAKTGVSVGNFEFSLGNLSATNFGGTAYPSTQINVNVKGSAKDIAAFADEMVKTMPIAEVSMINISGNNGSLTIAFYYKPYPAQNISDTMQVVPLSPGQLATIKKVSGWNSVGPVGLPILSTAPATSSAESLGSPF
jgi:Tfp pilus assembly protein PilO